MGCRNLMKCNGINYSVKIPWCFISCPLRLPKNVLQQMKLLKALLGLLFAWKAKGQGFTRGGIKQELCIVALSQSNSPSRSAGRLSLAPLLSMQLWSGDKRRPFRWIISGIFRAETNGSINLLIVIKPRDPVPSLEWRHKRSGLERGWGFTCKAHPFPPLNASYCTKWARICCSSNKQESVVEDAGFLAGVASQEGESKALMTN